MSKSLARIILNYKTQLIIDFLNKNTNLNFCDASYKNDAVDSILNKETDLLIYLPNSKNSNPDKEEFNIFFTISDMEMTCPTAEPPQIFEFKSKEEVASFFNSLLV